MLYKAHVEHMKVPEEQLPIKIQERQALEMINDGIHNLIQKNITVTDEYITPYSINYTTSFFFLKESTGNDILKMLETLKMSAHPSISSQIEAIKNTLINKI